MIIPKDANNKMNDKDSTLIKNATKNQKKKDCRKKWSMYIALQCKKHVQKCSSILTLFCELKIHV